MEALLENLGDFRIVLCGGAIRLERPAQLTPRGSIVLGDPSYVQDWPSPPHRLRT